MERKEEGRKVEGKREKIAGEEGIARRKGKKENEREEKTQRE